MRISDWSSDVCSSDLRGIYDPTGRSFERIFSVRAVHMAADLAAGDGGKRRVDFPLFRGHDDAAFWRIYDLWRQEQFLVAQVFSCIFGWCAYLCRICSFNLVAGRSGGVRKSVVEGKWGTG